MAEIRSDLFGSVAAPCEFDELMRCILDARCGTSPFRTWMWRGQADIDWPVHSSLFRRLGTPTEADMREAEQYLLARATHKGYRHDGRRELSDIELMAKLQHHGAATRLLDVSRNVLVGLWFASIGETNKTGMLLGVHSDYLGGDEGRPLDMSYDELLRELAGKDHPFMWEPPPLSPRIAAQHSQFLLSTVAHDKRGSIHLPDAEGAVQVIALSPVMKRKALDALDQLFDIRNLTMFPDFDGFCGAHSQRHPLYANERW